MAPSPSLAPSQTTAQPTPRQYAWQAATALPTGAIDGFMTYEQARGAATTSPSRPMILFFHHPQSRTSRQQVERLQADAPALRDLLGRVPVAWIDVAESPQLAQQLGVFRAPMWSIYDRTGRLLGTHAGILSVEQLEQAVASTP
jgi:thioredoxin-like negative regulator of GroEL